MKLKIRKTDLTEGGFINYFPSFFDEETSSKLYNHLKKSVPWRQEKGKYAPFPRLTAWYADRGLTYTYSGVTHTGIDWTEVLIEVKKAVSEVCSVSFNSLLCNFYRDGKDSIGFHSDAEPELGRNPTIASLSLGSVRTFIMRHMRTKEEIKYNLPNGSLLIMGGTSQHYWFHGVPKVKEEVGGRINLTFRKIIRREEK